MIPQKPLHKPKQDRYYKPSKLNLLLHQSSNMKSSLDTTATVNQQAPHEPHECRICLSAKDPFGSSELYSPCNCTGSVKYMHKNCFLEWMNRMYQQKNKQQKAKMLLNGTECEICKFRMSIKGVCETKCANSEQIALKIKRKPVLFGVFTLMLALCISVLIFDISMIFKLGISFENGKMIDSLIMICAMVVLVCLCFGVGYFYIHDYFMYEKFAISDFGLLPSNPNPQVVAQENVQQYHIDNSVINLEN